MMVKAKGFLVINEFQFSQVPGYKGGDAERSTNQCIMNHLTFSCPRMLSWKDYYSSTPSLQVKIHT